MAAVAVLGLVGLGGGGVAAAGTRAPAASGGPWGAAREVPGTGFLNQGDFAFVYSVSCVSAGNCEAGGQYTNIDGRPEPFTAQETQGTWRTAKELPGMGALNHGDALIASMSCPSAGNCGAGGYFTQVTGHVQPFVVSEKHGTWGTAILVPGIAALNKGETAHIASVSCASAGNCAAGGYYIDASGSFEAFVVSQKNGSWGMARQVRGTAAPRTGGFAEVLSVSCGSPGNCSAGGYYPTADTTQFPDGAVQAFIVDEKNGTWGSAEKIAAALNTDGLGDIGSVSCTSAGNCTAGGFYSSQHDDSTSADEAFVVVEKNGIWRTPAEVPGIGVINKGGDAEITSMSCASAGNCSAGGYYANRQRPEAFVASEANGTWGNAKEIAGNLNQGGSTAIIPSTAEVTSISCASPGNCSAGGHYTDRSGREQAFVVSEANGIWGVAREVAGNLNKGGSAGVNSVSCASASHCSGGGNYADTTLGHAQAFVIDRT